MKWGKIFKEVIWAVVSAFFVMYFWNTAMPKLFYRQTVLPIDYETAFCLYALVRTLIEPHDFQSSLTINNNNPPPRRDWDEPIPLRRR